MFLETGPHPEPTPKSPHLTQFEGRMYDVTKLEAAAAALLITNFSLADRNQLADILESKYWKATDGQPIGPSDLLAAFERHGNDWSKVEATHPSWSVHIDKVRSVDYSLPALVYQGHLIDGIHRLTKALSEHAPTLPIKTLDALPIDAEHIE